MFLIVMGVSGCGKSTIGKALAVELGWKFYDADDFHPQANVEKMGRGVPLNDDDRAPWLESLRRMIQDSFQRVESGVLACSALKKKYRDVLAVNSSVRFVYLRGDYETILKRMQARQHFMRPEMLKSQIDALEEPKGAIVVDVEKSVEEIIEVVKREI